jgi:ubiquinone/menaquinone biosynthesis C-methylase UbiE
MVGLEYQRGTPVEQLANTFYLSPKTVLTLDQIAPVKADATALPFEKEFFDAVVSTDSYNYWGRDPEYLDTKLLPFVKRGGYIYCCVPGLKYEKETLRRHGKT